VRDGSPWQRHTTFAKVLVARDEQYAVAGGHTEQGDEPDDEEPNLCGDAAFCSSTDRFRLSSQTQKKFGE